MPQKLLWNVTIDDGSVPSKGASHGPKFILPLYKFFSVSVMPYMGHHDIELKCVYRRQDATIVLLLCLNATYCAMTGNILSVVTRAAESSWVFDAGNPFFVFHVVTSFLSLNCVVIM